MLLLISLLLLLLAQQRSALLLLLLVPLSAAAAFTAAAAPCFQVSKLMIPHFRYTLNINCNARSALINEGGTIESGFTPGPYAIRLSSAAYKFWRFTHQALPTELASRCIHSSSSMLAIHELNMYNIVIFIMFR